MGYFRSDEHVRVVGSVDELLQLLKTLFSGCICVNDNECNIKILFKSAEIWLENKDNYTDVQLKKMIKENESSLEIICESEGRNTIDPIDTYLVQLLVNEFPFLKLNGETTGCSYSIPCAVGYRTDNGKLYTTIFPESRCIDVMLRETNYLDYMERILPYDEFCNLFCVDKSKFSEKDLECLYRHSIDLAEEDYFYVDQEATTYLIFYGKTSEYINECFPDIGYVIIALLASKTENLFMVGDEDQSIYGFRAAYPQALLEFEKDHAGAKVLLMEDNFRSNANIVIAADRFIQSNTLRHKKQMRATRAGTCIVEEIRVNSRLEQYENLVKVAENCRIQTAILYRDNDSSIPLVDLLDRAGIDYKMRNAELLFFKNRVVQDIVSIIKLALNSRDTDSFMSIYYKVGTFLRKVDASNICEKSIREEKTVFDAAMSCGLGGGRIGRINKLRAGLKKLKEDTVNDALDRILNEMGYGSYLKKAEIGTSKIEILRILGNRLDSVEQLISRLSELEEIIKNKKNNFDCPLILSTIHSSKGLEYDTVYMIDVVDGILPERSGNSLKNVIR